MKVRKSVLPDLPAMTAIYERARNFMSRTGNPNQWKTYPPRELLEKDIGEGRSYVIEHDGKIAGTFVFFIGEDPTYKEIEGKWLSDEQYGVIHRIASSGEAKGVLKTAVDYALEHCSNVRIDTHFDNKVMQGALTALGFVRCGTVYVSDDFSERSPRLAFQKIK